MKYMTRVRHDEVIIDVLTTFKLTWSCHHNEVHIKRVRVTVMVFSATFNNISVISWQSVLLVEEIRVTDKLYHINVVSSTPCLSEIHTHNVSDDRHLLHR